MAQILDFNKVKKQYLTIVLPDEKQTKLTLLTPTKKLLTLLSTMLPDDSGDDVPTEEELAALYELSAQLLSRNKTGHKVTADELAELLDFEDLIAFFNAYTAFIESIANTKN